MNEQSQSADRRLIEYLAHGDAPCPSCGYNLHGVRRHVCPECGVRLLLELAPRRIALAPFVTMIVVAAMPLGFQLLLLATWAAAYMFGWGADDEIWLTIGALIGSIGLLIIIVTVCHHEQTFRREPRSRQWWLVAAFVAGIAFGELILWLTISLVIEGS